MRGSSGNIEVALRFVTTVWRCRTFVAGWRKQVDAAGALRSAVRGAVAGFGDADVGAVHPADAAGVVDLGAAIGVEHPPGFAGAV